MAGTDLRCVLCGRVLWGDVDDDPIGDFGDPTCGHCVRDREADGTANDEAARERSFGVEGEGLLDVDA